MGGGAGGTVCRNGRSSGHGSALLRSRRARAGTASRRSARVTIRAKSYAGLARQPTSRIASGRRKDSRRWKRKLRQAQRLEAMGTLAGGIAHDFNNILGAILGNGEMALRDAPKGSRLARDLESIMVAGERGRALVERVLTFSRSGVGARAPVHVERVVRRGTRPGLGHAAGERDRPPQAARGPRRGARRRDTGSPSRVQSCDQCHSGHASRRNAAH